MAIQRIKLMDKCYNETNIAVIFELVRISNDDDMSIFDFKVISTFEHTTLETQLTLFEDDLECLQELPGALNVTEITFLEPDLSFTIIDDAYDDVTVYVNFDSGLRHSNIVTDSGLALRLNVTRETLQTFFDEIIRMTSQ